jgi:hypothetical protein
MKVAFWDIALMMEAVRTSEASVNYENAWGNIQEDCHPMSK